MFMKTQTEITNSFYFCSTDIKKLSLETESYTNVFTYKGVVHTLILVLKAMKWLLLHQTLGYYIIIINEVADWIKLADQTDQTHIPFLPNSQNL